MKRSPFALPFFLFGLFVYTAAFSMGGVHPAGVPIGQQPEWPPGLADLLNAGERVSGCWVNANDWFYYAGDTDEFNKFLEGYAELKDTPLTLVLHSGRGKVGHLGLAGRKIDYDWEVKLLRRGDHPEAPKDPRSEKDGYVVILEVSLGGDVKLEKLKVPSNVTVKTGEKNDAFSKFIAGHEAKKEEAREPQKLQAPGVAREAAEPPAAPEHQANISGPAAFKSEKPRYAKVVVNADGSKVLSVVFDESAGTGKGYDILYADVNFNGKFDESEVLMKLSQPPVMGYGAGSVPAGWSFWTFPPIRVPVPYNEKGEGIPNPCEITFAYRRYQVPPAAVVPVPLVPPTGEAPQQAPTAAEMREEFSARCLIRLRQVSSSWEYSFEGKIEPSEKPEGAPVLSFNDKPTLELVVKPDGRVKGNAGVGLGLLVAGNPVECDKDGSPQKARVEIRKPDGEVVHEGEETLDKFTFG